MAESARPPLHPDARRWCVAAAAVAALPLLLLMPGWLAGTLATVGLVSAWSGARRPWPDWLRLLLTLSLTGLVLAAFGFRFGRDTGCALLLAMLALKLGETRWLRDGRSLVGFALFATFAAFLQDQGPLTLALAVPAVTMALAASSRMAEHEVPGGVTVPVAHRLAGAVAWVALAIPLAVATFWLFPRLPAPLWGVPENALARTGISDRMEPGQWLDLMNDDAPAFRARFFGPPPPVEQMYWRGPVLWDFDGRAWTRAPWAASLPPAPVEAAGPGLAYEITLEPTDKRFLFALDLPTSAPPDAVMGLDLAPYARRAVSSLRRYRLESVSPARFEPQLRHQLWQAATRLPEGYNPRTLALAQRWRSEGADDAEVIRRALAWFRAEFSYSLDAPPLGRHSVDEFLFVTRQGFCEHFSSSFAVLMRAAGIPARVVTGYAGGFRNPIGDYWLIRQSDAHAWTEVWLEGRGWTRIDPTAAVDPERVFLRSGFIGGGLAGLGEGLVPIATFADWLRRGWNELVLGFDANRQRLLLRPFGIEEASAGQLALAFATGVGLSLALTLWLLLRQSSPRTDPLLAAYARFLARLARAGVAKAPHEPPLTFAERAAARLPADAGEILALSRRFAAWRYAGAVLDNEARAQLARALRNFRPRVRARPLPGADP
ncbi:DUF3488 and DUF4129 domain-containing transglutaminase family protein [Rehaibacterium terrae]|uniref:transglutaminase TgpA family protein n=1 Tax=Rehaibacterium terrae TaxID=1341696 RepID=UPI00391D78B6